MDESSREIAFHRHKTRFSPKNDWFFERKADFTPSAKNRDTSASAFELTAKPLTERDTDESHPRRSENPVEL